MLRDLVAKGHELVLLRDAIDWQRFEKALEPAYCSDNGRPSIPVRMMAGLTFLKYMFGPSDQDVLDSWCENPYWQYFCGGEFFEHEPPTDQATMSRWRSREGEAGAKEMVMEGLASAVRNKVARMLREAEEMSGVKPQHAYCDLGYREHDYKGDCDVQVVNRFRKRKPRCVLRWWKRRSAIEPVIGHIKSDHRMERNMLGGELGDRLNAVLSAVGFSLVKLMKGLKRRWLKRLFLCLQAAMDWFAILIARLAAAALARPAAILRTPSECPEWGFA